MALTRIYSPPCYNFPGAFRTSSRSINTSIFPSTRESAQRYQCTSIPPTNIQYLVYALGIMPMISGHPVYIVGYPMAYFRHQNYVRLGHLKVIFHPGTTSDCCWRYPGLHEGATEDPLQLYSPLENLHGARGQPRIRRCRKSVPNTFKLGADGISTPIAPIAPIALPNEPYDKLIMFALIRLRNKKACP